MISYDYIPNYLIKKKENNNDGYSRRIFVHIIYLSHSDFNVLRKKRLIRFSRVFQIFTACFLFLLYKPCTFGKLYNY